MQLFWVKHDCEKFELCRFPSMSCLCSLFNLLRLADFLLNCHQFVNCKCIYVVENISQFFRWFAGSCITAWFSDRVSNLWRFTAVCNSRLCSLRCRTKLQVRQQFSSWNTKLSLSYQEALSSSWSCAGPALTRVSVFLCQTRCGKVTVYREKASWYAPELNMTVDGPSLADSPCDFLFIQRYTVLVRSWRDIDLP